MKALLILDECQKAQEKALKLVRTNQVDLTVLFILDATWDLFLGHDWLLGSDARGDFLEWMRENEIKTSKEALENFRNLAKGLAYTEKTTAGDIQKEILKEAANGYDLLIVANPLLRGLERIRKAVPTIVEKSPCDVLLVQWQAGEAK